MHFNISQEWPGNYDMKKTDMTNEQVRTAETIQNKYKQAHVPHICVRVSFTASDFSPVANPVLAVNIVA